MRTSKLLVAVLTAAALAPASAAAMTTFVIDAAGRQDADATAASSAAATPAAAGAPDQSFCSPVHDEINEWIYHEPHVDSWGPDYTVGWYGHDGNCTDSDVVALLVVSHRGPVSLKHPAIHCVGRNTDFEGHSVEPFFEVKCRVQKPAHGHTARADYTVPVSPDPATAEGNYDYGQICAQDPGTCVKGKPKPGTPGDGPDHPNVACHRSHGDIECVMPNDRTDFSQVTLTFTLHSNTVATATAPVPSGEPVHMTLRGHKPLPAGTYTVTMVVTGPNGKVESTISGPMTLP
jgi:hypothetical protein